MNEMQKKKLPDYVCIDDPKCTNKDVLRITAKSVSFPLSEEIKQVIHDLEAKFDLETYCAGLAAPQIGCGYQVIIFASPDDPKIKKIRTDLTQTMPKTIWLNPTYIPLGEETYTDWEGCFSILNYVGPVKRYKKISYQAFTVNGNKIEGIAEGFLARIIQHEIDHLNGKLCLDRVFFKELKIKEEYISMRKAAIEAHDELEH